jgi:phosphatidylglycerol:prolipoprotein diacylglycerol transferase
MATTLPWGMAMIAGGIRMHPVAVYAAILAVLFTVVLLLHLRRRQRRGDTSVFALAAVGIAQFLLTFIRQPDPSVVWMGNVLDPIQWVAIGMIAVAGAIWLLPRKLVSHAV